MNAQEQKAYFDTFGFLLMRQLLHPDEIEMMRQETDKVYQQKLQDETKQGGFHVSGYIESQPHLAQLVEDDRFYGTIENLLKPDFIWMGSETNRTTNSVHRWHCDRYGEDAISYIRIKIMIYLDPVTKDRGALRVVPGSHRNPLQGLLHDYNGHQQDDSFMPHGVSGEELPCFSLDAVPGDVVFFNQYLFHAVYGGFEGRRYMAFKYAQRPSTDAHLESIRKFSPDVFDPHEAFVNSDRPRIRRMVEGLREMKSVISDSLE